MSEDMSDIFNKIKGMLNNNNIPDNVKDTINNLSKDSSDASSENSNPPNFSPEMIQNMMEIFNSNSNKESKTDSSSNSSAGIDFETILKMKSIMEKMNSKDDPRSNLLLSLKPYLKESRKSKVEQYIQLFNMSKVMDVFKSGGEGKK